MAPTRREECVSVPASQGSGCDADMELDVAVDEFH